MALYLVTGGAGFIGSAMVRELLERGEQVRVVDNFSTGLRRNLAEVLDHIELVEADIRRLDILRPILRDVDYVLHLAALASVPRSVQDPVTSHQVNADGTLHVLVAARDAGVKRVVFAGSSSAYGDTPVLPKVETMTPGPISPYGVSKVVGEMYARVFTQVYGLETVCLRYFNVFGPRQDPTSPYSGVLSRFIAALLRGERPGINGDGEQSRDFTFVANAVEATLLASTASRASGKVINVAAGKAYTLNQTVAILRQLIATGEKPVYLDPRPGDIQHSLADISLAREVLGYEPRGTFEDGLGRTVEWYRKQFQSRSSYPSGNWSDSQVIRSQGNVSSTNVASYSTGLRHLTGFPDSLADVK